MKYAAFFRGINVGGKNRVKMVDLARLFVDCGFGNVKTYIQSGNVLFESGKDQPALSALISRHFAERFGFESSAVLRSGEEISKIISGMPFTKEDIAQTEAKCPDVEHVYVFLSNNPIDHAAAERLRTACAGDDKLFVGQRELYLLCDRSVRDSKLAASLSKLDASITSRNLKTMLKIDERLNADS